QDLLRLFVTADRPPLEGPLAFQAHVLLPPGQQPFLRRVRLDGDFSIRDAHFTNPASQEKVNELSARARGDKQQVKAPPGPRQVAEEFQGRVALRNEIATL